MRLTIFDTPLIAPVLRFLAGLILTINGWRVDGEQPAAQQYVMIAAPHTSNWDLVWLLAVAFKLRLKVTWVGKDTLFVGWRGPVMRWMGGLGIERSGKQGEVERIAAFLTSQEQATLIIAPEGSRQKTPGWKSGFYHIARAAEVPIVLTYLDYGQKRTGIGATFTPTGDYEADLKEIQGFYKGMKGRADL